MEIKQYIKENEARFMEELFSLIRIPSISALPEHKDDMLACALRWKELLLAAGADEAMVMPSQGNPLVFAQKHVSNDAPTLLIYAHYDVMPSRWTCGKASLLNLKFVTDTFGHVELTMIKDKP
jgi:acetylornithine deacetylase/succinyl-diaminopimelate desuccinylase-like protein